MGTKRQNASTRIRGQESMQMHTILWCSKALGLRSGAMGTKP